MLSLQNTIMVDNSRMFACLEDATLTPNIINRLDSDQSVKITNPYKKRSAWMDLQFKNEEFSIYSGTGDLMCFAANPQCPETLLNEFLGLL